MERVSQQPTETLSKVLARIERDISSSLGSEQLAKFLTTVYDFNGLKSLGVSSGERYSSWTEQFPGITRMVTAFPDGSWQIKTTFESFDDARGVEELNIATYKDSLGNIIVDGDLPISLVETYLFETSRGKIDKMRSLLFNILELVKPTSYAIRCKLSNEKVILFGFPLTTLS